MPLPRFHTIHYAGVLAAASPWRSRLTPPLPPTAENVEPEKRVRKSGYRPWAELLQRTFAVDVLTCPSCQGRMRLLAVVKNPAGIARYLAAAGELTEVPERSPPRAPPYWKSQVLRRQALGDRAMAETTTTETTRRRSERTGSPEFRRGCGASHNCGNLRAPQPLGGGIRRARLLPNYAGPTPIAAPRPREWAGTPPSNRLRSQMAMMSSEVSTT